MVPDKLQDSLHSSFTTATPKWRTVRDALEGEVAIKAANTRYLPMPSAMLNVNAKAPSETIYGENFAYNDHENKPYAAYKARAFFPELTDATLRGIVGLIQRNPSAYAELPDSELLQKATPDGKSLQELELLLNTEVMSVGRVGLLVDIFDNKLKFVVYKTEAILNWQTEGTTEDIRFTGVLLQEESTKANFWDQSASKDVKLLLFLDEKGIYTVARYEDNKLVKIIQPSHLGKTLNFIPFITIGTLDLTPDIDNPPMWPLANLSVKIYQASADLRNAQYMSCNPTLTLSGVDQDQLPSALGSNIVLALPDPMAKAYYPKTDTTALDHVRLYIKDLEQEAIKLGANLLGHSGNLAESGEAIRLRQSMAAATVASVVATTGKGLLRGLKFIAEWLGANNEPSVKVNKEFSSFQMTANEQIALVQSWQAGALSSLTMLENFRRAGMLQEGEDPTVELERLQNDVYREKLLQERLQGKDISPQFDKRIK